MDNKKLKIIICLMGIIFSLNFNALSFFNYKLNQPLAPNGYVAGNYEFALSEKNTGWVVYQANPSGVNIPLFLDVFKVPVGGGMPINLSAALMLEATGGRVG